MRLKRAHLAIYRIPPHLGEPFSDAVQTVTFVELISLDLVADTGETGWGFTYTIGRGGSAIRALLVDELLPLLVDVDPLEHELIGRKLRAATRWVGRTGLTMLAIAAIDNALWDLKAKNTGLPLFRLLGGSRREVPIYASDAGWLNLPSSEMRERAVQLAEQGFQGIKIKVGREQVGQDIARVRETRQAVGDSVPIMVDANGALAVRDAVRLADGLGGLGVAWFEEPVSCDDVAGHIELRSKSAIPVAVGESLYSKFEFADYVARRATDIVQPDAARIGITEWLNVAKLAESFGLAVAPHAFFELHTQLVAAIPNGLTVEHIPYLDRILEQPLRPVRGFVTPPDRPGHGITLDVARGRPFQTESQEIDIC